MRDIENIIKDRKVEAALLCKHEKRYGENLCLLCSRAAIVSAYTEAVIPKDYRKLTIDSFSGDIVVDGRHITVLSDDVLLKAKEQLRLYCWKGIEAGEPYNLPEWFSHSLMEERLQNGVNVIIHGESAEMRGGKIRHKQLGKTLLASIIMKEAILLKFLDGHVGDSYEWADFSLMCKRLMESAANNEKAYDNEINNWEDAEWLVVDNITFGDKTTNAKQFRANVLDKIFLERRDRKLPNILVFQDDIDKCDDISGEYGSALSEIITSRKTLKICLSGKRVK